MNMRICNATLAFALMVGASVAHAQTTSTQSSPTVAQVTQSQTSNRYDQRARVKRILSRRAMPTSTRAAAAATRSASRRISRADSRFATRPATARVTRVAKTQVRPPLDLTPVQRTTIYRELAEEPVVAPAPVVAAPAPTYVAPPPTYVAPATTYYTPLPTIPGVPTIAIPEPAPPVVAERVVTPAPPVTEEVITEPAVVPAAPVVAAPPPRVVATTVPSTTGYAVPAAAPLAPTTVSYRIGGPLPAGVPVYALPPEAIATAPGLRSYGYATIGRHVLLIDPRTNVVVQEIYQ
ncbi:MAG TPA: hypothetical protein VFB45_21475 [Pseudolabrys sp.]|nr:hypothetical protein [Pseudolabrys sp.]